MHTYTASATTALGDLFAPDDFADEEVFAHDDNAFTAREYQQLVSEVLALIAAGARVAIKNDDSVTLLATHALRITGAYVSGGRTIYKVKRALSAPTVSGTGASAVVTGAWAACGFPAASVTAGSTGYMIPRATVSANTSGYSAGDVLYLNDSGTLGTNPNISKTAPNAPMIQRVGIAIDSASSGNVALYAQPPVPNPNYRPATINADSTLVCFAGLYGVTYITTASRTGGSTITLPAAADGAILRFVSVSAGMKILPASGSIYHGDSSGTVSIENTAGGALTLVSDGTNWYVLAAVGIWTVGS